MSLPPPELHREARHQPADRLGATIPTHAALVNPGSGTEGADRSSRALEGPWGSALVAQATSGADGDSCLSPNAGCWPAPQGAHERRPVAAPLKPLDHVAEAGAVCAPEDVLGQHVPLVRSQALERIAEQPAARRPPLDAAWSPATRRPALTPVGSGLPPLRLSGREVDCSRSRA